MQEILEQALAEGRTQIKKGEVASYIPELAKADKNHLGICVFTKDGGRFEAGDTQTRFSIQSISKVISLAMALEKCGFERVFEKIGMEPSGDAFNSLIKLDMVSDAPYNPMINSGAISVAGFLTEAVSFEAMLEFSRKLCMDPQIEVNRAVFYSEMANLSRNRAIAYLLESKGVIKTDVERCLELYVRMCSLNVTAKSLAGLGLILANGGIHPESGERLLDKEVVRVVKTIIFTCGMYDGSGEFAVSVGIPTKSGVGGGLLSVADKKMGIGIYGPSLDKKGNSIAGRAALKYLSERLGLHMFAS